MKIHTLAAHNFRSLAHISLEECAGLNILIGRNNSGKSNVLSAIELSLTHFSRGSVAGRWPVRGRVEDEFANRQTTKPVQIAIEFSLNPEFLSDLMVALKKESIGYENAVDSLPNNKNLVTIIRGAHHPVGPYLFLEEVGIGRITTSSAGLSLDGQRLFFVPPEAGEELFSAVRDADRLRTNINSLQRATEESYRLEYAYREKEVRPGRYLRELLPTGLHELVEDRLKSVTTADQALQELRAVATELEAQHREATRRPIKAEMQAFAGVVKRPPVYVNFIMRSIGANKLLHFRESRQPIGGDEASLLLQLKTRRGASNTLSTLQTTVKSLLGVHIDAFQSEAPSAGTKSPAEMDIDNFLIEANGAGIREALRIVLDLELKKPVFGLIEEPEVHLHPGLEKALHTYLVDKSKSVQLFVATHSASFVDSSLRQNVYLVSKDSMGLTTVGKVKGESDFLELPAHLGLRPSSVLMFDRLIFVEGPSDEAILREFAVKLGIDLASASVNFISMGGLGILRTLRPNKHSIFCHDARYQCCSLLTAMKKEMPMSLKC